MLDFNTTIREKELKILECIQENKFKEFKKLFEDNDIIISFNRNLLIKKIVRINRTEFFLYVFNHKKFNKLYCLEEHNYCIRYASEYGNLIILELLLNIKGSNASDFRNLAIRNAFENNHTELVDLLWSRQEVKDSLNEDCEHLYNRLKHSLIVDKLKKF
jgi:hypothetical protein